MPSWSRLEIFFRISGMVKLRKHMVKTELTALRDIQDQRVRQTIRRREIR